jgi:serine/threonine protein kinase
MDRLGHYRIVRQIGLGGAATVYLAEDEDNGQRVALKVLHKDLKWSHKQVARLKQEAEWVAGLRHPNVVQIREVGQVDGFDYMATEYIDGVTVREMIPPELPPLRCVDIARGIADGLSAAHENWIVHRDIKPENVMVSLSGQVKVLDFGLAKLSRPGASMAPLTGPGMIVGTLRYLAPEQVMGQAAEPRTDLFSTGVVLYEMLAGRPPFEAESNRSLLLKIMHEDPPPLTSPSGEIPQELVDIVIRALQKDPDERYQTAEELSEDLRHCAERLA